MTSKRSLLIVDDQAINIELLTQALKDEYVIHSANSGMEALNRIEDEGVHPDLILLDIQMPGMDGLETCRRLSKLDAAKSTPVMFVSSLDRVQCKAAGFEAGAVDYVTKPFNVLEVQARIRTHMSLKIAREELMAARERYRRLSEHDDLTGLFNTRYLYQGLADEEETAQESGHPFCVLFMDIDRFKDVVDQYGHLNGSTAIAQTAEVIRKSLPPRAWAVSYGGDEFVVVLPATDKAGGLAMGEKILESVRGETFLRAEDINLGLSLSCGVAAYPDDADSGEDLLALADRALFEAKRQGKNTVRDCAPNQTPAARQPPAALRGPKTLEKFLDFKLFGIRLAAHGKVRLLSGRPFPLSNLGR